LSCEMADGGDLSPRCLAAALTLAWT